MGKGKRVVIIPIILRILIWVSALIFSPSSFVVVKNSSLYAIGNINTSFWGNWCHFPDWLPFQVSSSAISHSQPLHIPCSSSKSVFFCLQPWTYGASALQSGYYALPQQPLLYALPISTKPFFLIFCWSLHLFSKTPLLRLLCAVL